MQCENLLKHKIGACSAPRADVDFFLEESVVFAMTTIKHHDVLTRLGERPCLVFHVEILDLDRFRSAEFRDFADVRHERLN